MAAGNHSYTVKFAGDKYFNADEKTVDFEVSKLVSEVKISVGNDYSVGDSFTIKITNNTAAVVTINSKTYYVKADGTLDIGVRALL